MVCGLLAILDGRATFETLYRDHVPAGQNYGIVNFPPQVFTYSTRTDYIRTASEWVAFKY